MENPLRIYFKPEIFDHLIYPISIKLDDEKNNFIIPQITCFE